MISEDFATIAALDAATVTLSEFEAKRCEKLVAQFIERRRPPPRLRKEVDLAFRIKGLSVEIFEIRAIGREKASPLNTPLQRRPTTRATAVGRFFGYELI